MTTAAGCMCVFVYVCISITRGVNCGLVQGHTRLARISTTTMTTVAVAQFVVAFSLSHSSPCLSLWFLRTSLADAHATREHSVSVIDAFSAPGGDQIINPPEVNNQARRSELQSHGSAPSPVSTLFLVTIIGY